MLLVILHRLFVSARATDNWPLCVLRAHVLFLFHLMLSTVGRPV